MNKYLQNPQEANEKTLKEILAMNELGYEFIVEDGVITDVLHR